VHPVHGALEGAGSLWPENRCEILRAQCGSHRSVTWSTAGFIWTETRIWYQFEFFQTSERRFWAWLDKVVSP